MSDDHPIVSVVIPTYNRARYVTQAIDSVLAQTYTQREIIVVDDGSADETAHVLAPYRGKIRYIRQDNQGPAAARNTGIAAARGEWVAFLDSDDEWLPGKLSTQMADVTGRADLCAHVTNVLLQRASGQPAVRRFDPRRFRPGADGMVVLERPLAQVLARGIAVTSALLARKDALVCAGLFDTGLKLAEDIDLFLRLSLQGPWALRGEEMVRYHRRNADISLSEQLGGDARYRCGCVTKALEKVVTDPRLTDRERRRVRRSLAWWLLQMGEALQKAGDEAAAHDNYRRALQLGPSLRSLARYGLSALSRAMASAVQILR